MADFSGSDNIKIEGEAKLVIRKEIGSKCTEDIADVRLLKNWKLKSKFRFTLKNPPVEKQRKYLGGKLAEHNLRIEAARKVFGQFSFSMMSIEQCFRKLRDLNAQNFVDLDFEPGESSVFDQTVDNPLDVVVHWRRPLEFLTVNFQEGLLEPNVFYETIEPNDVRPGVLGDEWFLSSAALLAERPALIERLFITKEINSTGIYKLRLCKNGEWVTVTVDDFFPCYPDGEPVFAKCHGNELWVLLLEKAYAKLHGNYYLLRGGFAHEALLDLTGCPCVSYDIGDEYVQHFVENGQFWELLRYFDDEGYLLSLSTNGEGRWIDNTLPAESEDPADLPRGHAFSVVMVKEAGGN